MRLSFYYAGINNDSALYLADRALKISKKYRDSINIIRAHRIKGVAYFEIGNTDSMMLHYNRGAELALKSNEELQYAHFKNNIGNHLLSRSVYDKAIENFYEAKRVYDVYPDLYDRAMINNNLSLAYRDINDYDKALKFARLGLEVRKQIKDSVDIANSLSNIASIYILLNKPEEARTAAEKAIDISHQINDTRHIPNSYVHIACSYRIEGDCEKGIEAYKKALEYSTVNENQAIEAENYNSIAYALYECDRYDESIENAELSLKLSRELDLKYTLSEVYYILALNHIQKGNSELAIEFTEKWKEQYTLVYNNDLNDVIAESEVSYRVDDYKRKIELEKLKKEQEAYKNKVLWYAIAGILVIVSLLIFFLYQFNRRKHEKALAAEKDKNFKAIIYAEEKERQRIARELHDGIVQQLGATVIKAQNTLVKIGAEQNAQAQSIITDIENTGREVRDLSHQMMPRALESGLVTALEELFASTFSPLQISYDFEHRDVENKLPDNVEITLYRIAQELVNNIIKHSQATSIQIQLFIMVSNVIFMMEDNGVGLKKSSSQGIGMKNIKTRVDLIKGDVKFNILEPGTLATIKIPLDEN
ncbi:tetratricopeptide repeat-containing sensor histidine kinase [Nonlabens spongiae]|nr:tetratricopeptide repeat protein [Nonlabens spongiae]